MAASVASHGSPGILFLCSWSLIFVLHLESLYKKSCRSFTSFINLLPKRAQYGLAEERKAGGSCTLQTQARRGKGLFPGQRLPHTSSNLGFIAMDLELQALVTTKT